MVDYNLSKYLKARLDSTSISQSKKEDKIITISREYGCDGEEIADLVIKKLNKVKSPIHKQKPWKLISKEILQRSAKELKVHPGNLESIMMGQEKGLVDEILLSFYDKYPNDIKVKHTIKDVIEDSAKEGYVVILGRGGEVITLNWPNSFHFKITAPFEWRVHHIMHKKGITKHQAEKLVYETDQEREDLKNFFLGDRKENVHYHSILNRKLLSVEQIAETIVHMMD